MGVIFLATVFTITNLGVADYRHHILVELVDSIKSDEATTMEWVREMLCITNYSVHANKLVLRIAFGHRRK